MTIVVRMTRMVIMEVCMTSWAVAEAKAKFSEVVEQALSEGPQEITRNGKQAVTVIATKELERLRQPKQSLAEFLLNSPLRGSGLTIPKRNRWKARPVKF
jgi:prevent-host-death family protein